MSSELSLSERVSTVIRRHLGWCPRTTPMLAPLKHHPSGQEKREGDGGERQPDMVRWIDRIPFENPWILSLIAATVGSAVMTMLGLILGFATGSITITPLTDLAGTVAIGFVVIFVICFIACMLEFR